MLVNVNVKNLALINQADIYFDEGLNILTGETGAGKSILIGSILIALGGKVSKDIVRDNTKEGVVELVFYIDNDETIKKLENLGINVDDRNVIISRKIVNGRSSIKLNGENITTKELKKITELLIDIHGQHEHQSLLKRDKQLKILDDFAGKDVIELKDKISKEYSIYTALNDEIEKYNIDDEKRLREIAFCRFEIDEIDNANLSESEYVELKKSYHKMISSKTIVEKMHEVYELIAGEGYNSISDKIGEAYRLSQSASVLDDEIVQIAEGLSDLESICEDVKRSIKDYVDSMSFDEEESNRIESRLDELNRLISKYNVDKNAENPILNIIDYRNSQEMKLNMLENFELKKKELSEKIKKAEENLGKLSKRLSEIRFKKAKELAENIKKVLTGLNFIDIKFEVEFSNKSHYSANGTDEIQFLISTNPGESLKPLSDVASGGELSRIMLGIKTIMAKKDEIDTLIFDEIDTGISGRTAQMVAERLKEISVVHQVICITHLPQIAAMADNHYLIDKTVNSGVAQTNIYKLSYEDSVEELSRMLGGIKITDAVRENAREMKKLVNN